MMAILNRKASLIVLAANFVVVVIVLVFHSHTLYHKEQLHLCPSVHVGVTWINDIKATESMTAEEIYRYLHWTNSTSCQTAIDFGLRNLPVFNNCLVYSFGINNQWTFDEDMADFGCHVYSFDPSMNAGNHNRSERIHFYDIGLDGKNRLHPTTGWKMRTASSIYHMLTSQHGATTIIDVLKMDIEFSEWDAIPQMLQSGFLTDKVKQLAVEIHFNPDDPLEAFRLRVQILRNLKATSQNHGARGFVRFSSRPNPWLKRPLKVLGGREDYTGLELAWYNSKYY